MKTTTRIIPKENFGVYRFGQLLINALCSAGYLEQVNIESPDINDEQYGHADIAYKVTGTDLFYLENDELEKILQDFLTA